MTAPRDKVVETSVVRKSSRGQVVLRLKLNVQTPGA